MKPQMRFLMVGVVVTVAALLVVALFLSLPGGAPLTTLPSRVLDSWNSTGDYGVGVAHAVTLGPVTVPIGTSPVFVAGEITADSWHRYEGGSGNVSGNCTAGIPESGVCNVFVGVWAPAAWTTFASGGSATPIWCYTAGGSTCANASDFSFVSSDLAANDGSAMDIVVWNVVPWGIYGSINVTVDVG